MRGPLFSLIYINYLSQAVSLQTLLFANDISIITQYITLKETTLNAEFMMVLLSRTNGLEQMNLH